MPKLPVVAVTGSTSYTDYEEVASVLKDILPQDCVVIHGGAKGAEENIQKYCDSNDITCITFAPYFKVDGQAEFNPRYFFMVNKQLVKQCDYAIVFHDGSDSKSRDMIARLEKAGKTESVFVTKETI